MHLRAYYVTGDQGTGRKRRKGMVGNARKTWFRSRLACKNRSSYGADTASRCWNSISLVYVALPHPVANVKRIKYFLAAGGSENSNVTMAPRISADFVRELKLIERLSRGMEWLHTLACAFTPVTMYILRARYMARDYRYDRSNRYLKLIHREDFKWLLEK